MEIKSKISRNTWKIFKLYIVLFYLIPFIGNLIFPLEYIDHFRYANHVEFSLIIPVGILSIVYLDKLLPKISIATPLFIRILSFFTKFHFNLILSFVFLYLAYRFRLNYSINFRHVNTMSEGGIQTILLFALIAYFRAYIFVLVIRIKSINTNIFFYKIISFNVLLGWILSLNSSFDIIYIFVAFLILINQSNAFFFLSGIKQQKRFLLPILLPFLLSLLIIGVVFVGIANKIGIENTLNMYDSTILRPLFVSILIRLSVWYNSICASGYEYLWGESNILYIYSDIFSNIKINLLKLLGDSNLQKPEIWSINRKNFLNLFYNTSNPKTGTSPGLFATFFYIPFFPFNLIILSFYSVVVLRIISLGLSDKNYLTPAGVFILLFFLMTFFESPIDLINPINPSVILLLTTLINLKVLNLTLSQTIKN